MFLGAGHGTSQLTELHNMNRLVQVESSNSDALLLSQLTENNRNQNQVLMQQRAATGVRGSNMNTTDHNQNGTVIATLDHMYAPDGSAGNLIQVQTHQHSNNGQNGVDHHTMHEPPSVIQHGH